MLSSLSKKRGPKSVPISTPSLSFWLRMSKEVMSVCGMMSCRVSAKGFQVDSSKISPLEEMLSTPLYF